MNNTNNTKKVIGNNKLTVVSIVISSVAVIVIPILGIAAIVTSILALKAKENYAEYSLIGASFSLFGGWSLNLYILVNQYGGDNVIEYHNLQSQQNMASSIFSGILLLHIVLFLVVLFKNITKK